MCLLRLLVLEIQLDWLEENRNQLLMLKNYSVLGGSDFLKYYSPRLLSQFLCYVNYLHPSVLKTLVNIYLRMS